MEDDWMAERLFSLVFQEEQVAGKSLFKVGPQAVD